MTTIQPADGVHITVGATDVTTDGQRNLQQRLSAFQREFDLNKRELQSIQQDLNDALTDRDVLTLKLAAYRTLLQRVVDVDEACTGDAYAQLIEDVKAALEVQS